MKKEESANRKEKLDRLREDMMKSFSKSAKTSIIGSAEDKILNRSSTGYLRLDSALGGGFIQGGFIELAGKTSAGKTSLAIGIMAHYQSQGKMVGFVDVEQTFDGNYAKQMGLDLSDDKLYYTDLDIGEEAWEAVIKMVESEAFDLIVVDSMAAMTSYAETDGDMADNQMAVNARLNTKALKKLKKLTMIHKCTIIGINQLRDNMNKSGPYDLDYTTPGGRFIKFAAAHRLHIFAGSKNKQGEEVIGRNSKVWVIKNKGAAPGKSAELTLIHEKGFVKEAETIDLATKLKIIVRGGAWFTYRDDDESKGGFKIQGTNALLNYLMENKKVHDEIKKEVIDSIEI